MSLSVRTRFEVFKRDRFTCSYCGRHTPDVLLEVDHIVPRAAGGSDEITNLTTACADCNRGKSDKLLDESSAPTVTRAVVDDLRERLEQAAAYTELVGQQAGLADKQLDLINEAWARTFGAVTHESAEGVRWAFEGYGRFPDDNTLRRFIRTLPVHEVLAAVEITGSRFSSATSGACKFFYAVCWRRIRGESGPIDQPRRSAAPVPSPVIDDDGSDSFVYYLHAELKNAQARIADLEDENAELRASIDRLREDRPKHGWTRIGDVLRIPDEQ